MRNFEIIESYKSRHAKQKGENSLAALMSVNVKNPCKRPLCPAIISYTQASLS